MRVVCYCDNGGYCCAIAVTHTGAKSGCKLVTLFDSYSYDMCVLILSIKEDISLFERYSLVMYGCLFIQI